jgi:hypothetical protein
MFSFQEIVAVFMEKKPSAKKAVKRKMSLSAAADESGDEIVLFFVFAELLARCQVRGGELNKDKVCALSGFGDLHRSVQNQQLSSKRSKIGLLPCFVTKGMSVVIAVAGQSSRTGAKELTI